MLFFILFGFIPASCNQSGLDLIPQTGNSCMQNPDFLINSFIIDQWPPVKGEQSEMLITGEFLQGVFLNSIHTGIKSNNQWYYEFYSVDQFYGGNSFQNFTVPIIFPEYAGNFYAQVTFRNGAQLVACWEFYFNFQ